MVNNDLDKVAEFVTARNTSSPFTSCACHDKLQTLVNVIINTNYLSWVVQPIVTYTCLGFPSYMIK